MGRRDAHGQLGVCDVARRGRVDDASSLAAVACVDGAERCGLATYRAGDDAVEVVTLDALRPALGVGTRLLADVAARAARAGSRRLWLVTTSDHLGALSFYRRGGLRVAAVHHDAVREARRHKPQIPLVGRSGLDVRDEVELELDLVGAYVVEKWSCIGSK